MKIDCLLEKKLENYFHHFEHHDIVKALSQYSRFLKRSFKFNIESIFEWVTEGADHDPYILLNYSSIITVVTYLLLTSFTIKLQGILLFQNLDGSIYSTF